MDLGTLLSTFGRTKLAFGYKRYFLYLSFTVILGSCCACLGNVGRGGLILGIAGGITAILFTAFHPVYFGLLDKRAGIVKYGT